MQYPSANVTAGDDTALRTGLLAILEAFDAAWAAAESIIAVTAVGPALVAVATLALIAVLAARRRRATMGLARSRGASGAQVLWPALVEGLLVAVPAGRRWLAVAALVLVDGGRAWPSVAMAAAVVAIAMAIVLATVVPVVARARTGAAAGRDPCGRLGGRRLVLEGLVVALAVGAAFLLRERGVGGTATPASRPGHPRASTR